MIEYVFIEQLIESDPTPSTRVTLCRGRSTDSGHVIIPDVVVDIADAFNGNSVSEKVDPLTHVMVTITSDDDSIESCTTSCDSAVIDGIHVDSTSEGIYRHHRKFWKRRLTGSSTQLTTHDDQIRQSNVVIRPSRSMPVKISANVASVAATTPNECQRNSLIKFGCSVNPTCSNSIDNPQNVQQPVDGRGVDVAFDDNTPDLTLFDNGNKTLHSLEARSRHFANPVSVSKFERAAISSSVIIDGGRGGEKGKCDEPEQRFHKRRCSIDESLLVVTNIRDSNSDRHNIIDELDSRVCDVILTCETATVTSEEGRGCDHHSSTTGNRLTLVDVELPISTVDDCSSTPNDLKTETVLVVDCKQRVNANVLVNMLRYPLSTCSLDDIVHGGTGSQQQSMEINLGDNFRTESSTYPRGSVRRRNTRSTAITDDIFPRCKNRQPSEIDSISPATTVALPRNSHRHHKNATTIVNTSCANAAGATLAKSDAFGGFGTTARPEQTPTGRIALSRSAVKSTSAKSVVVTGRCRGARQAWSKSQELHPAGVVRGPAVSPAAVNIGRRRNSVHAVFVEASGPTAVVTGSAKKPHE